MASTLVNVFFRNVTDSPWSLSIDFEEKKKKRKQKVFPRESLFCKANNNTVLFYWFYFSHSLTESPTNQFYSAFSSNNSSIEITEYFGFSNSFAAEQSNVLSDVNDKMDDDN